MRFDVRDRRFCFDSLRFPLSARFRRTLTTMTPRANVEVANVVRQPGLPARPDPAVQCATEAVGGKPAGSPFVPPVGRTTTKFGHRDGPDI